MGYNAKGKSTVAAAVRCELADYIKERGERLDKSQSWALGRVIDFWICAGAPALSEIDRKMDPLPIPKEILPPESLRLVYAAEDKAIYNPPAADVIQHQMEQQLHKAAKAAEREKAATRLPRK